MHIKLQQGLFGGKTPGVTNFNKKHKLKHIFCLHDLHQTLNTHIFGLKLNMFLHYDENKSFSIQSPAHTPSCHQSHSSASHPYQSTSENSPTLMCFRWSCRKQAVKSWLDVSEPTEDVKIWKSNENKHELVCNQLVSAHFGSEFVRKCWLTFFFLPWNHFWQWNNSLTDKIGW